MIISSSFSYLFFSLALFQCSVILPVLYRSAPLFHAVLVVLVVFRCSDVVPSFHECSVFRHSMGIPCSSGVPLFWHCSVVPRVFCPPQFRVPVFLVLQYALKKRLTLAYGLTMMSFFIKIMMGNQETCPVINPDSFFFEGVITGHHF